MSKQCILVTFFSSASLTFSKYSNTPLWSVKKRSFQVWVFDVVRDLYHMREMVVHPPSNDGPPSESCPSYRPVHPGPTSACKTC